MIYEQYFFELHLGPYILATLFFRPIKKFFNLDPGTTHIVSFYNDLFMSLEQGKVDYTEIF